MIKYQNRLITLVNNLNIDTFPRSLILSGLKGCGKHTLFNYIVDKLQLPFVDISDMINLETISNIYERPEPYIYLIDYDKINESNKSDVKQQNMLLKFIEEPLKNSFIIFLTSNIESVLPTIKNRCIIYNFESYTKEMLSDFIEDKQRDCTNLLSVCYTPGDILKYTDFDIDTYITFTNKIITKIKSAYFANALTISDKIAFDNEKEKFDLTLINRCLAVSFYNLFIKENNYKYITMYKIFNDYMKKIKLPNINKKYLFESFITELWRQ